MNEEISAGGLVFCKHEGKWHILLIKDRQGMWTFPKGKIEQGEEIKETALREIQEETGVTNIRFAGSLAPVHYWYTRGVQIKKTVHYFFYIADDLLALVPQTEEGITDAQWIVWDEIYRYLGYKETNKPLLEEALAKLS